MRMTFRYQAMGNGMIDLLIRYACSMTGRLTILSTALIAVLLLGSLPVALADDDYIEARRLQDADEILSLEDILKNVRQTHTGRVLEVELETEDGRIVYEIELLSEHGVVSEIYIDAKTGVLLFEKEDD